METSKRCPRCRLAKPFTEFYRNRSMRDGYESYCRECHKAYRRAPIRKASPLSMSDLDRGWLAGLIEGEGSFHLRKTDGRNREPYRYPSIRVGSTDLDVLEKAHAIAGIGTLSKPPRPKGGRKDYYVWQVSRVADVMSLIQALQPIMGGRRKQQIQYLLENIKVKDNSVLQPYLP